MTVERMLTGLMRPVGILLMSAATVLNVVSCGDSDDTVTPDPSQPKPIAFSGSLSGSESESNTRATSPAALQEYPDAEHGHTTFYVWSYKNPTASTYETVMKDYTVNWQDGSAGTTTTNSRGWEYVNQQPANGTEQSIKYWDFTATSYRFFGYTGSNVSASYLPAAAPTSVSLTISGIDATAYSAEATPSSTIPLYSKLWYKTGSAIAANIQPVTLEFIPPVARVRFMFNFVEGLSYGRDFLYNIKFHPTASGRNVAKAGSVTITYPLTGSDETQESWTSNNSGYYDNDDLAIDYYEASEILAQQRPDLDKPQHWYYVLPQEGAGTNGQGSYTLSVSVGGSGDPKTCEVPANYMTWVPGYDYTYIFKITEGGGVSLDNVQVGINSWNVKQAVEHPVYNW